MRLTTIWTLPGMALRYRLDNTYDVLCMKVANMLPTRLRFWTYISVGSKAIKSDEVVTDALFTELLARTPK